VAIAHPKTKWSLAPVLFKTSSIEGRGVFAKQRFSPGDLIVPYAPKQRRLDASDPEAIAASATKLTLLSGGTTVIVPDTSVPGGWLTNHGCEPNAALYSDGEGRIQCVRRIAPGEEVTIFYGWVTENEPERDPCHCGSARCRGFINFDVSDVEAEHFDRDTPEGAAFQRRFAEYRDFVLSIGQEHVLTTIANKAASLRARNRAASATPP
jgi:hypothetical protein